METIELSEFIKKTLVDIVTGVKEANNELQHDGVSTHFILTRTAEGGKSAKGISFDIGVNATKGQKDKAGFSISLVQLGAGANVEKAAESEMVQRISFDVDIDWNIT